MANVGNNPFEVELLTTTFTSQLDLLLQQMVSLLRGYVDSKQYVGKMGAMVNQIGVVEFKQAGVRYGPIVPQIPQYRRPWVFPNDRDIAILVDQFDELRTIVDPKGGISQAVASAGGRYIDDLIIAAANGTVQTGVDASSLSADTFSTTVSTSGGYLVADTFGASASTGLTWPKVVETERVMRHAQVQVDAEKPCMIIASQQNADLQKQQEIISKDYGGAAVFDGGRVRQVGIFDVIVSERLNSSSSNTLRNCLAWVPSGMHLGIWRDMNVRIDNRIDLSSQPWQLYAMLSAGAARTQDFKVVQVNCADTSGFDPTAP